MTYIPRSRNLDHPRFLSPNERLHPRLGRRFVVDLGPRILIPQPIRLAIVGHVTVIVPNAKVEEHVGAFFRNFPPRRDGTDGRLAAAKVGKLLVGVFENVALLFHCHRGWVLRKSASDFSHIAFRQTYLVRVPV